MWRSTAREPPAEKFGVPECVRQPGSDAGRADIDMVLITTPIPLHFANAMAAIAAGKHVYVQKSMTVTTDEADLLLAARDRAGVKLVAAPGFELFPLTAQLREAVQRRDDRQNRGRVHVCVWIWS